MSKSKLKKDVELENVKIKKTKSKQSKQSKQTSPKQVKKKSKSISKSSSSKTKKKPTKKLTENQKEYEKQKRRIKRNLSKLRKENAITYTYEELLKKMDVNVSDKHITKKQLAELKSITPKKIRMVSYYVNESTGETETVEQVKKYQREEKKKLNKLSERVIENFKSSIHNDSHLTGILDEFIKSNGKYKTARVLQELATSEKLFIDFIKYPSKTMHNTLNDLGEVDENSVIMDRSTGAQTMERLESTVNGLGGSKDDIEKILSEYIG